MKLNFSYDEESDTLTIEGLKYAGSLFRAFANKEEFGLALNTPFEIVERKDGVITVRRIESTHG